MSRPNFKTTPLLRPEERPAIEILSVRKPPFWRVFWIAWKLLGIIVLNCFKKFSTEKNVEERARHIREFLERLGGVWIKVGQVLALRNDLFPAAFCSQLSRLHDRAMGFSPELSKQMIERELGQSVEDIFEKFEKVPFAAASLSQVHKARLRESGEEVVVKVQRPHANAYFSYDFRWISALCKLLMGLGMMKSFRLDDMLVQIRDMMVEELDYRYEASNLRRLGANLGRHDIYAPKIYLKYVTKGILVLEFLEGVFVSDYARVNQKDPERAAAWARENGIDPQKVASILIRSVMRQVYEDLLFHGDLHPGNVILGRDNGLAFIDFGNIGRIDPKFAKNYNRYFRSMSVGALDQAADSLLIAMGRLPALDVLTFKKRIMRLMEKQIDRSYIENLPYHERSIAGNSAEMSAVMNEFGIEVNWHLLKMGRAFETIDQNIGALNPKFNFVEEVQLYHEEAAKRKRCERLNGLSGQIDEVSDFFNIIKSIITDRAFQFGGQMSRLDQILVSVSRWLAFGVWAVLIFGGWIFLYQNHFELVDQWHTSDHWLSNVVEDIPTIDRLGSGVIFALLFIILWKLPTFIQNLLKSRNKTS